MNIYPIGDSANRLNALTLDRGHRLTYRSARDLLKRLVEGVRRGALGKKLNSLLEGEFAHLVVDRPRERRPFKNEDAG